MRSCYTCRLGGRDGGRGGPHPLGRHHIGTGGLGELGIQGLRLPLVPIGSEQSLKVVRPQVDGGRRTAACHQPAKVDAASAVSWLSLTCDSSGGRGSTNSRMSAIDPILVSPRRASAAWACRGRAAR